jgi:hypothetical protein
MSTLIEIEAAAEHLPAAEQEELLRFLASRLARPADAKPSRYRVRTHPGGVLPGIDPDKLAQLPDDF